MVSLEELRKENLMEKHKIFEVKLIFDNPRYRLEQIYFWLLDFLRDGLKLNILKISDTFEGSVASAFFTDIIRREGAVVSTAQSLGKTINDIIKSIIALNNDYRTCVERAKLYEKLKSENSEDSYESLKALKSIWLDSVDIKRGGASLRQLSTRVEGGYPSVIELFFKADIKKDLEELVKKGIINKSIFSHKNFEDISIYEKIFNERVISIVKMRLLEFYRWIEESKNFLYQRKDLTKAYLLHQINSLIYYTEMARPYFRAARMLMQKEHYSPDLVKAFESAIINISLFASKDEKEIEEFDPEKKEVIKKKYVSVFEIDILARVRPTLAMLTVERTPIYSYVGRTDITYRAYLLEKSEYEELLASKEIEDFLYIEGITDEFLRKISNIICNYYVFEKIISDKEILDVVKKFLKKEEIKEPEDIEWTRELFEEIEKIKKDFAREVIWIKKYLPSKKEEIKQNIREKSENYIFPVLQDAKDLLSSLLYKFLEFLVTFGKDISYIKYNIVKKKAEEEKKKISMSTKDLAWTIYNTFKKAFGLLSY